jgi:hypothetical protein
VWYGIIRCSSVISQFSSVHFTSLHLSLFTFWLNRTDVYYEVSKNTQVQNNYIKIKHQTEFKKIENEMK